jgi:hypothetical protein
VKIRSPRVSARRDHLYTFWDKQDRRRFDLEAMFGHVENMAAPVIARIASRGKFEDDDFDALTAFLSLAALRTPAAIEEARASLEGFKKVELLAAFETEDRALRELMRNAEYRQRPREELVDLAKRCVDMVQRDAYTVQIPELDAITQSLKSVAAVGNSLWARDWMFAYAKPGSDGFLTTDTPVMLDSVSYSMRSQPLGYGSEHAQVLCPLSHSCAVIISGDQGRVGRMDMDPKEVDRFNRTVVAESHSLVFGRDPVQVKRVTDEVGLTGRVWVPRSQVGVVKVRPDSWQVFLKRDGRPRAEVDSGR